jgi:hypothetical protein
MTHLRLTHPDRQTLPFKSGQSDEYRREAVANVTTELGTDRPSLVHTETREGTRTIRGRVSAPRLAEQDGSTDDWRQALANYVDELESHVDEFQGDGYTLEDDQLNISKNAILESVNWTRRPGRPYDIEYEATVRIGRGTFESRPVEFRNPTVQTSQTPMLVIDGVEVPGLRQYQGESSVGLELNAVFDRDTAENNDAVLQAGTEQRVTFEGTHTGTLAERQAADADLDAKVATTNQITLETRFPGYSLEGYVLAYSSDLDTQYGGNSHQFALEFLVGERA